MKTLEEILVAVKSGERPVYEELRYALCVMDALLIFAGRALSILSEAELQNTQKILSRSAVWQFNETADGCLWHVVSHRNSILVGIMIRTILRLYPAVKSPWAYLIHPGKNYLVVNNDRPRNSRPPRRAGHHCGHTQGCMRPDARIGRLYGRGVGQARKVSRWCGAVLDGQPGLTSSRGLRNLRSVCELYEREFARHWPGLPADSGMSACARIFAALAVMDEPHRRAANSSWSAAVPVMDAVLEVAA